MLDLVHDIQKAYRVVLDCMARPGAIGSIQSIAEKAEGFLPMPMAFEVFMHLLLDTEVTFYVCAQQEAVLQRGIHQLTYAREDRL
jgi:alpha-D-ribose 1-methylphosphonate 5-triphosphate synthase subunit PhnH